MRLDGNKSNREILSLSYFTCSPCTRTDIFTQNAPLYCVSRKRLAELVKFVQFPSSFKIQTELFSMQFDGRNPNSKYPVRRCCGDNITLSIKRQNRRQSTLFASLALGNYNKVLFAWFVFCCFPDSWRNMSATNADPSEFHLLVLVFFMHLNWWMKGWMFCNRIALPANGEFKPISRFSKWNPWSRTWLQSINQFFRRVEYL